MNQKQSVPLLYLLKEYIAPLEYMSNGFSVSLDQVRALIKRATNCSYYIKTECIEVSFDYTYWVTYNGEAAAWVETGGTFCQYTSKFKHLRPWQNGSHFAHGIFNCIFLNENVWISINWWFVNIFQVTALCLEAASHYLNQGWPSFMMPYGVTRSKGFNVWGYHHG